MQPSAAHGTAFRRSPALCKASGFMTGTAQSRKAVKVEIVDRMKTPLQSELSGVGHSGVFLISLVFSMLSRLA